MKKSPLKLALLGLAVSTTIACLTINVYFPEAAIRDLAERIEDEVGKGIEAVEEGNSTATETPASGRAAAAVFAKATAFLAAVFATTPVYAQEDIPDPGISNPAIRKIIESRRQRIKQLNAFKARGVIGESNEALLAVRNLEAVSDLRQRAEVQRLVKAENADREKLFREIATAQNVDLSQLPRIQETYAGTLRAKARKGDWIQLPNGQWSQKN